MAAQALDDRVRGIRLPLELSASMIKSDKTLVILVGTADNQKLLGNLIATLLEP